MTDYEKLKRILVALDPSLPKEELVKALEMALFLILKIEQETGQELTDIRNEIASIETTPGPKGEDGKDSVVPGPKGDDGKTPIAGVDFPLPKDGYTPVKGKDYFDGEPGKTPVLGVDYTIPDSIPGKDAPPQTPEQIRDSLEELTGDNRLDASAIKGLKEEIKTLKGIVSEARPIFGPGKTRVILLDLSSQMDGVNKTFTIGTNFGVIGVWGSSAPNAFRPIIDYQEVGRTIVFDPLIDAASMLASGQTLICQYLR